MNSWSPFPLLRLVLPFIAGILIEFSVGSGRALHGHAIVLLIALLTVAKLIPVFFSAYSLRWISGLFFTLFLFLAGYQLTSQLRITNHSDFISGNPEGTMFATISEPPSKTAYGYKTILSLRLLHTKQGWQRVSGNAIAYLKTKPGSTDLQFGDFLLFRADLDSITDNSNPHSFNYPKYLSKKGITHRIFADSWRWQKSAVSEGQFLRKLAFQSRDRLLEILRDNNVTGKEFAVAAALLLGYVGDLSPELMHDYSASGAMHVLSVSGMHVGIIYLFFEFMLGFLNRKNWGRWLKAVILLLFIWFYAMLTGLSPCVFRSAAMLTLPILSKALNREVNMYNVIAASLFLMLVLDPFVLLDVGFQLSYLAVAGLVVLYKPIYDLYVTSAWLPDKIWSVLAVSIAAQISTLPITLYVFHQFPNYFLLTNLVVVPLSSLIIYVGILLMAVGYVPVLSLLVAKLLVFLIWLMNSCIHFIESLPWSTITGIHISSAEMVILYLLIITGFLFLTFRRIPYLYIFLLSAIGFMILTLSMRINQLGTSRMVVFNIKRIAMIELCFQKKAVIFYGNGKPSDRAALNDQFSSLSDDMKAHGIGTYRTHWIGNLPTVATVPDEFIPVSYSWPCLEFASKRIFFLNSRIPKGLTSGIKVDYVIVSGNPRQKMEDIVKLFAPETIILDGTNARYNIKKWKEEAESLTVKVHAVAIDGAFEKEL